MIAGLKYNNDVVKNNDAKITMPVQELAPYVYTGR